MNRFALMVLQGDSPEESERQAGTPIRPAV
jgi:hypothetical protein